MVLGMVKGNGVKGAGCNDGYGNDDENGDGDDVNDDNG